MVEAVAARILASAFEDDPLLSWVFDEPRFDKLERLFAFLVDDALADQPEAVQLLDDVACAAWTPPGTEGWGDERMGRFLSHVASTFADDENERLGALDAACRAAHPTEPHWYLGNLGVRADVRSKGHGGELLRRCLADLVDRDGLPAYLESSNSRNLTLYLRHGFEVVGEITDHGGPALTAMWRPAR